MIDFAPFASLEEHVEYCRAAGLPWEDGSVGFKIFSDEEKLGLCIFKFVGDAAYVLGVSAIDEAISVSMLENVFQCAVEFLVHLGVQSVVFPIQNENDVLIAEQSGFDKVSPTLYVFDFPSEETENSEA